MYFGIISNQFTNILLSMKKLSEEQIDDLLKLKFGSLVTASGSPAYVSN